MRPICWLHVSDIHMRVSEAWSHDVVLRAMCDDIARQRAAGLRTDFILATGDLAFSGKADEYRLTGTFFDAISASSGVQKERIFCIPGNHDVDRDRQKMCFQGARHTLVSTSHVDSFLTPSEDLETLLKRQENYRRFQESYCQGQGRTPTPDGLAYVSSVVIDDIRLAIVGLNSAWLAEGGMSDHGELIVGERQVIDVLEMARKLDPHVVIAMAHHPFHLLQEFDRGPVQGRIEDACHFLHCGHLHEPETRHVGRTGPNCLIVAAGASFETRQSRNSYSAVTLDLLNAKRTIKTIEYAPRSGAFTSTASEEYPIEITPAGKCSVHELAMALAAYSASLSTCSHYLAALLLDAKSEVPIPAQNGYTFGSFAVLQAQPDSEWKRRTLAFKAFSNVLRVFYRRLPLSDLLQRHGDSVARYGSVLQDTGVAQSELRARVVEQERDARLLAEAAIGENVSHGIALLAELAKMADWPLLREHAARHLDSPDRETAVRAKRMMALGLAHSDGAMDKSAAVDLYRSLAAEGLADAVDIGNLATLLAECGGADEAKAILLDGIERFGSPASRGFHEIGLRIVEATGDKDFRKQLEAAISARHGRD